MITSNRKGFFNHSRRSVGVEFLLETLYFPLWWYSVGFFDVLRRALHSIRTQYQYIGLGVWAKNIFVPMFGQYDWEGRLISFFVRLIQVIVRTIFFLVWVIFVAAIIILWLALPVYTVYQIIYQVGALRI